MISINPDIIRIKCDRVLLEKAPEFSQILNNRIQHVYENHADKLGSCIDYGLLTDFTSELLTAYTNVISKVMMRVIQEVLSDDSFCEDEQLSI